MSKTYKRLERILEVPVKYFQYDATDPMGSMDLMVAKLKKLKETEEDILVMGSSLGGFMATILVSITQDDNLALFNPSLFPVESLKKYVGRKVLNKHGIEVVFTDKHVNLYGQFNISNALNNISESIYCNGAAVFLTDDPVLDSKRTADFINSFKAFGVHEKYDLKGHRLDDEKIINIKDELLHYYEYLTVHWK